MKNYNIIQDTPKYKNCKIGMRAEDHKDAIRKAPLVVTGRINAIEEVDRFGEHVATIWKREEEENRLSIDQLAEKLGGRVWRKYGKERIYLRRGHTTRKMSTSTFVYWDKKEKEYAVHCHIVCPSQSRNWIKSQQDLIISEVKKEIEDAHSEN